MFLDDAEMTGNIVALGIPIKEPQGRVVRWEQPPDSSMVRYLMSILGKEEDFGKDVTLHHTADEGIDIGRRIDKEIEEKQKELTDNRPAGIRLPLPCSCLPQPRPAPTFRCSQEFSHCGGVFLFQKEI